MGAIESETIQRIVFKKEISRYSFKNKCKGRPLCASVRVLFDEHIFYILGTRGSVEHFSLY